MITTTASLPFPARNGRQPGFDDAIQNRLREEEQQRREAAFLDHQGDCFALYQLHRGPELRDLRDISLERLRRRARSPRKGNYDLVYTAPLTGQGDTFSSSISFGIASKRTTRRTTTAPA